MGKNILYSARKTREIIYNKNKLYITSRNISSFFRENNYYKSCLFRALLIYNSLDWSTKKWILIVVVLFFWTNRKRKSSFSSCSFILIFLKNEYVPFLSISLTIISKKVYSQSKVSIGFLVCLLSRVSNFFEKWELHCKNWQRMAFFAMFSKVMFASKMYLGLMSWILNGISKL